ncbi:MAG: hypothetical protein FWE88_03585 [Phycisphaerae bacterium]|nr:hypothetical protein [Phycisphaerae bacterium]
MKYRLAALVSAAVVVGALVVPAWTASDSSDALNEWELTIDLEPLASIRVAVPGEKTPQLFWFLRYTVSNHTGDDQIFAPDVFLYTDTGDIVRSGKDVPPVVFARIKSSYNDPLLKDQISIGGKLLQGEDNAKNGVAIFSNFDPKAGTVEIFFGGLSSYAETLTLPVPVTVTEFDIRGRAREVEKTEIQLNRTLRLKYRHPLDPNGKPRDNELKLVSQEWVMR